MYYEIAIVLLDPDIEYFKIEIVKIVQFLLLI